MKSTYLVQRLVKPLKEESMLTALGNAFAFGGGYKNGGLSDEAFNMIKRIFRFAYMGYAEYEFGEVPKALEK